MSDVIDRLRKICGMLGSSHEGERSAAVSCANELLKKNNLTWADVIGGQNAPPPPPPKGKRQREWEDVDDDEAEIDMEIIPEALMDDDALIAYGERFLHEHEGDFYDLGDTTFMQSVIGKKRWTPKMRAGLVRSLRRAWMIRRNAGW